MQNASIYIIKALPNEEIFSEMFVANSESPNPPLPNTGLQIHMKILPSHVKGAQMSHQSIKEPQRENAERGEGGGGVLRFKWSDKNASYFGGAKRHQGSNQKTFAKSRCHRFLTNGNSFCDG